VPPTSIVSVDLAYTAYSDIGVAVMTQTKRDVRCDFVSMELAGMPKPVRLAHELVELCERRGAAMLILDGPQAWRDPRSGIRSCRACERAFGTAAKTRHSLRSCVPRAYQGFIQFSISVFDALHQARVPRLSNESLATRGRLVAAESYPNAAWKRLGLPALASKRRTTASALSSSGEQLASVARLHYNRPPSHDELQAAVAGLGALTGDHHKYVLAGASPSEFRGVWREGFIVMPRLPEAEIAALVGS